MTPTLAQAPTLSAMDRCDRCGAQAYVRVVLTAGGELLFCAHHFREHEHRLRASATAVHDETARLAETPAAPSDDDL